MKQVPDRKRLRQEVVNRRWSFALHAQGLVIILVTCLYLICEARRKGVVFGMLPLFILMASGVLVFARETHQKYKSARETYVVPVTPDTLPADKILVRGSEEPPVTQSEVLLRAAQRGQETPKEELLRVAEE